MNINKNTNFGVNKNINILFNINKNTKILSTQNGETNNVWHSIKDHQTQKETGKTYS